MGRRGNETPCSLASGSPAAAPPLLAPAFLVRLRRLCYLARRVRAGALRGARGRPTRGPGPTLHDYRRYSPGDDPRGIDWNLYARLDQLYLKESELPVELSTRLLVDRSASMALGRPQRLLTARRLAALLGAVALFSEEPLALSWYPPAPGEPPRRPFAGRRALPALFDALARPPPEAPAAGPLPTAGGAACWAALASCWGRRGQALLITDTFDEPLIDHFLHLLRHLRLHGAVLRLELDEERAPRFDGAWRLADAETGAERLLAVGAAQRAEYRRRYEAQRRALRARLARAGVRLVVLDAALSFDAGLLAQLARARVLRA